MRSPLSLLAAALLVATPLATAGGAMADPHGGHRGHDGGRGGEHGGGRWNGGGGRGAPAPRDYRGEGRGGEGRGDGRYERIDPRGGPRGDYRYEQRMDPRYDPRVYAPPPNAYSRSPRRGGYLGPGGEVIQDYGRFRLRPPPRGYEWVRTPGGMALVSQGTGQVFDVVPY